MDKSCHSSGDSTTTSATSTSSISNRDQYLSHLNRISHKISKPTRRPAFVQHQQKFHRPINPPPPPPPPPQQLQDQSLPPPPPQQPPVYNIDKSDFRDVVQKLTGSPAHERFSTPPPIQPPKPPSSRLQRIRPPPLAQLSNRPPPLLNNAVPPQPPGGAAAMNPNNPVNRAAGGQRQVGPLSPLPPFPAVHAASDSPISAYMRYLHSSISAFDFDPKRFPGPSPRAALTSPKWNNLGEPQPLPPASQHFPPSPTSGSMAPSPFMPSSPLPFGCYPRSPYPLLSPGLLLSPSSTGQLGFQQFPVSPRLPVPSPGWKNR